MNAAKTSRTPRPKTAAPKTAGAKTAEAKPAKPAIDPAASGAPSPPEAPERPDPVPAGIAQLVGLFSGPLSEVRFPDVDREKLESACEALRQADAGVQAAFAALEAAQTELEAQTAVLHQLAERGLAYARIFAAGDEALEDQLSEVNLGSAKKARKGKAKMIPKADKPRKAKPAEAPPEPAATEADDPAS